MKVFTDEIMSEFTKIENDISNLLEHFAYSSGAFGALKSIGLSAGALGALSRLREINERAKYAAINSRNAAITSGELVAWVSPIGIKTDQQQREKLAFLDGFEAAGKWIMTGGDRCGK